MHNEAAPPVRQIGYGPVCLHCCQSPIDWPWYPHSIAEIANRDQRARAAFLTPPPWHMSRALWADIERTITASNALEWAAPDRIMGVRRCRGSGTVPEEWTKNPVCSAADDNYEEEKA